MVNSLRQLAEESDMNVIKEEVMEFMDEVNDIIFESKSEKPTPTNITSEHTQIVYQAVDDILS